MGFSNAEVQITALCCGYLGACLPLKTPIYFPDLHFQTFGGENPIPLSSSSSLPSLFHYLSVSSCSVSSSTKHELLLLEPSFNLACDGAESKHKVS